MPKLILLNESKNIKINLQKMSKKSLVVYTFLILFLIVADQGSKTFLISYLKTQAAYSKSALPFLDIVYAWNYGISFGLFGQHYQYSNHIFLVLNSIIIIYLFSLFYKSQDIAAQVGFMFIIGGALGNLIDRLVRGAVFDFIYFHYSNYSFPAFNLADSFISIGAVFFVYSYIKELDNSKKL